MKSELRAALKLLIARSPTLRPEIETEWKTIEDMITTRAAKRRPKPLVFEVHHEIERARETFFRAILLRHEVRY